MVTAETTNALGDLKGERPGRSVQVQVAIATALLCAGVVAVTLAGAPADERLVTAVVFGLLVAAPMIVGLVALNAHADDRFARLLIAAGAMFSLTALSQSDNGVLYASGGCRSGWSCRCCST